MENRANRITFGHLIVALTASGLTYVAIQHPNWFGMIAIVAAIPVAVWIVLTIGLAALDKGQCPACGGRKLRRYSVSPFGFRYFRCKSCGAKCKRRALGAWYDASGRRDAAIYDPGTPSDPWGNEPVAPESDATPGTHGVLLRNKRHRQPSSDDSFGQ